jgi:hypothetical protein
MAKKKEAEEVVEEVVEDLGDIPEITPIDVDYSPVASIHRTVSSEGNGILNVRFVNGAEEQYPCDDEKWAAFQADETDWAVKAKKFYGSL